MIAVDYYWNKAEEALEKADAQSVIGSYFMSVALVYRSLADGETKFRKCFPGIPPRTVERNSSSTPSD